MLSRLLGQSFFNKIVLFLYALIAFALPFNKVILSLTTVLIALVCVLDINKQTYRDRFKSNRALQILLLFLIFHLLSFFWSSNTSYFLKDLNAKLPIYILIFSLIFKPLQAKKDYYLLFGVYLFSITFFSIWNFTNFFLINFDEFEDLRNMSRFTSHIRFGLMLIFGIVITSYWLISKELKFKFIALGLLIWFLVYTYYAEVFSAYLALVIVLAVAFFKWVSSFKYKRLFQTTTLLLYALIGIGGSFLLKKCLNEIKAPSLYEVHLKTAEGNYYFHDLKTKQTINGHHVYSNIAEIELHREWDKVSHIDFYDTNRFGYINYYILVQYMASKGLKKDALGFKQLSSKDIKNVEKGRVNYLEENYGFLNRLTSLKDEFADDNPNGKTLKQRYEYLKTGMQIFKENMFIGVGSGDLDDAFQIKYQRNKSTLKAENRLRAHNQIFTYFISFGIIGGIIFLGIFFVAIREFVLKKMHLSLLFMVIMLVSFLSEDTLETQVGATFFAFFFGLMIGEGKQFLSSKKNDY